jgi:hypothetical protein
MSDLGLLSDPVAARRHQQLLYRVLQSGLSHVYRPGEGDVEPLSDDYVLMGGPIQRGNECIGVVQIFRQHDVPDDARPGYMQFVEQMCGQAARFLQRQAARPSDVSAPAACKDFDVFVR